MADAKPRPFIWYDLVTTDVDGATAFYAAVTAQRYAPPAPDGGMDYRHAMAGGEGVGGCVALSPDALAQGAKPIWVGYLYVPDVDASVAAMEADDAKLMMPPFDVDGAGRIALIADPWGAPIHIMTPDGTGEATAFSARPNPGHIGWNELVSPDPDAAVAFYKKHFGWEWPTPMDMGAMGQYHFFISQGGADCDVGGMANGAIMRQPPQMPRSVWTFYIWTDDIDAAMTATTANGGTVLFGPHEVPGGLWRFNGVDPQGASFAMVGHRAGATA